MPTENQRLFRFRARGVFDATLDYRANDWMAYNGIPYLASRSILANNPPDDVDNPTNGWARLGDSVIRGPRGITGVKGDSTVSAYLRSATTPTAPTATWNGSELTLTDGWTLTIPSGTDILYRVDVALDNDAFTATVSTVERWTGPTGPEPSDTRLDALIAAALNDAALQNAQQVNAAIEAYLQNNEYRTDPMIRDIINEAYTAVLAELGAIQVEYAFEPTSEEDWGPTNTLYDRVRVRLNNPDAAWHIILLGQGGGGSTMTTGLPITFQYATDSADSQTYHNSPRVNTDTAFRFKIGTGDFGDWLPLGIATGMAQNLRFVMPTNITVANNVYTVTQADLPAVGGGSFVAIALRAPETNTGNVSITINGGQEYPVLFAEGSQIGSGQLEQHEFMFLVFSSAGTLGYRAINLHPVEVPDAQGQLIATATIGTGEHYDTDSVLDWVLASGIPSGFSTRGAGEFRDSELLVPNKQVLAVQRGWLVRLVIDGTIEAAATLDFGKQSSDEVYLDAGSGEPRISVNYITTHDNEASFGATYNRDITVAATDTIELKLYVLQ